MVRHASVAMIKWVYVIERAENIAQQSAGTTWLLRQSEQLSAVGTGVLSDHNVVDEAGDMVIVLENVERRRVDHVVGFQCEVHDVLDIFVGHSRVDEQWHIPTADARFAFDKPGQARSGGAARVYVAEIDAVVIAEGPDRAATTRSGVREDLSLDRIREFVGR